MKPKFDGYAAQYDAWFMENDNLFQSELAFLKRRWAMFRASGCFRWAAAAVFSRA